jgi:hypothetical protein
MAKTDQKDGIAAENGVPYVIANVIRGVTRQVNHPASETAQLELFLIFKIDIEALQEHRFIDVIHFRKCLLDLLDA